MKKYAIGSDYKIGVDIDSGRFYVNETFDYYDWKPATVEKTASFIRKNGSFYSLFKSLKRDGGLEVVKEILKRDGGGTSVSKALSIVLEREGLTLQDIGEFAKFLLDFGMRRAEVEVLIEKKINFYLNMELNTKLHKELEDEEEVEEEDEEEQFILVSINGRTNRKNEIRIRIDKEKEVETIFDDFFQVYQSL